MTDMYRLPEATVLFCSSAESSAVYLYFAYEISVVCTEGGAQGGRGGTARGTEASLHCGGCAWAAGNASEQV